MTPLEQKYLSLPKFVDFELDIKPELDKAGISKDAFERDCRVNPNFIPRERIQVYADIFNCNVQELQSDLR